MWAITCIIVRVGAPYQELTYFSKEKLREGDMITVPLRGKDAYALVLTCTSVSDRKQAIRTSSFALRKLTNPKPHRTCSKAFLRAAFECALQSASPPGSVIAAYISTQILLMRHTLPEAPDTESRKEQSYEPLLFSHAHSERLSEYKRLARESLARGTSIMIITPTIIEAEHLAENLQGGIQQYVVCITSARTKKRLGEAWTRALTSTHPVVIIGTPIALSLPRSDITAIVCEREGSSAYARNERPYTHAKVLAEYLARGLGARFILAGIVPSITSAARTQTGEITDMGISTTRIHGKEPLLIDLREHKKNARGYDPLTPRTHEALRQALSEQKSVLVLAARKGLAPLTICDDCGDILTCTRCKSTLVLHQEGDRHFLCHHCGQEEKASVRCRKCGGWRLTTLGIAIDTVEASLTEHFPEYPLHTTNADDADTKTEKTVALWQEKGGMLLGGEHLLPYLPDEIPCIVIASIDSFLSIPEYTAGERAFTLLAELKSRARELFLIQTRDPSHPVMRGIREGSSHTFIRDELKDREQFAYPPFTTLIRFTSSGKQVLVEQETRELLHALESFAPQKIQGRTGRKGEVRAHILIRLHPSAWVHPRLLRFIRTLPPSIEVRVNPTALHTD